jgi:hypothetical protein
MEGAELYLSSSNHNFFSAVYVNLTKKSASGDVFEKKILRDCIRIK